MDLELHGKTVLVCERRVVDWSVAVLKPSLRRG